MKSLGNLSSGSSPLAARACSPARGGEDYPAANSAKRDQTGGPAGCQWYRRSLARAADLAPRPALLRDKVLTDEPLFKRITSYV